MRSKGLLPTEHASQCAFFDWWNLYAPACGLPVDLCYAVPNGGLRHPIVAKKLKAEGVRKGIPDVNLDIPSGGFHGLRLEFKRPRKKPTKEQEAVLYELRRRGYNALVVYSTAEAIHVTKTYLHND